MIVDLYSTISGEIAIMVFIIKQKLYKDSQYFIRIVYNIFINQ